MSKTQIFSPVGGMNQDDSIITPTRNSAGRNAFELGDYRYALNARIGSSKSDHFGDLETLKGTVEKTSYYVRSVINSNPTFVSGLTGWSQTGSGTAWTLSGSDVVVVAGVGDFSSRIIYQSLSMSKRVGIRLKVTSNLIPGNAAFTIMYLQGTTVLSTETILVDADDGTVTERVYSKYISKELPSGCDGIGLQVAGYSGLGNTVEVNEFKVFDWISGARPSGTERVIGKLENKEFNLLFYHVYNSAGNHCIRYYDPVVGRIYELLKWSGLSYQSSYFVSMAMIDNYIGFTDRNNSPRLVDFYSISDLYITLGSDFREYHISFHKWAPVTPIVVRGYYDTVTNNYKKFENKTLQFAYRYIYSGKLKSRFSPISNVAQSFLSNAGNQITSVELYIPGFSLDTPGAAVQYNYFNNNNIKFTTFVESVEIAYRESPTDLWRLFKRADVKYNYNEIIRYEGKANSTPIPENDFNQIFDTVPFKAGAIEAIDNRFIFADILDENDAAASVIVSDVSVVKYDASLMLNNWWNAGNNNSVDNAALFSNCPAEAAHDLGLRNYISKTTFKGRGLYKLGIQWLAANGWRSATYTVDNWIYEIPEETGLVDKIYALTFKFPSTFKPPSWAVAYQIVRTNCLNIDYFLFGTANSFQPLIDDTTAFNDNLQIPLDVRDRIRQHFENSRLVTAQDFSKYLDSLLKNPFYKAIASDVRKTIAAASLTAASRLYIDVNNWYNSSASNAGATSNNPMNNLFYNYRDEIGKQGDRVRFMASTVATPADNQKTVYDMPILEFTGRGIIIEKPAGILWLPGATDTDPKDHLIEVYTPKIPNQSDDYLYHEVGEWYPVLYPGTEQRDLSKRDWTFTVTTAVTSTAYGDFRVFNKMPFRYGDCHAISRTYYYNFKASDSSTSANAYTASMNSDPKKSYSEWEKNIGRSYPAYTDLPVVKFKGTQVRFGGQAVEESFVNNINRFRDEDQKIYPSEYGRIRALVNTANAQVESVGAILLAIGERESFSIYVNRTTLEDLSGQTSVALSDKVLGSYNTLLGSHGTLNPESVSVHRGRVYFWDATDGEWIRYGRDGLTSISSYKMRSWFKDIGRLLRSKYATSEQPKVISEFDPFNDELTTFITHSSLSSSFRDYTTYKGANFSETDTRWKTIHSYEPEMFAKIDDQLYSFKDGSLFIHEEGVYSTFYGSKKDVYIEPVFNKIPKDVKSWMNLGVVASHKWSAERILSEYRGAKNRRQTSIGLMLFKDNEDSYYAAIPQDQNTMGGSRVSGDRMRSKAISVLMKLDPTVSILSLLHYVEAGEIDSPKNL